MIRRIVSTLVFVAVCVPVLTISASSPATRLTAQTAPTCTDSAYLTTVGTDFTALGSTFKAIDATAPESTANAILGIATARQKYEDTPSPTGCFIVNVNVIVTLANAGDLAALILAKQVDKKTDPKVYDSAITAQAKRFGTLSDQLKNLITGSAATPAATAAQ